MVSSPSAGLQQATGTSRRGLLQRQPGDADSGVVDAEDEDGQTQPHAKANAQLAGEGALHHHPQPPQQHGDLALQLHAPPPLRSVVFTLLHRTTLGPHALRTVTTPFTQRQASLRSYRSVTVAPVASDSQSKVHAMLPRALFLWRKSQSLLLLVVVVVVFCLDKQCKFLEKKIATQKITLYIKNNRKLDHLWWIFTFMHADRLLQSVSSY